MWAKLLTCKQTFEPCEHAPGKWEGFMWSF